MSTSKANNEYYFVPLGRDPGGFLDFLGLPPTATEADAKVRENEFRDKLEVEFKSRSTRLAMRMEYQNLKEKLRKNEKSGAEFSADVQKMKERHVNFNDKLMKLTARLKEKAILQEAHTAEIERLRNDFDALTAESDASPITKEEMEAEVEKWKKEKSDHLEYLNSLNTAYQLIRAHQRDLRNKGIVSESELWRKMFIDFGQTPTLFWKLALSHRPLMSSKDIDSINGLSDSLQENPIGLYLDFLGLSPDATEEDVKLRKTEQFDKLKVEFKVKTTRFATRLEYQTLKELRKKNNKADKEFSQEVEALREKHVRFNAKLLKLSARLQEKAITQGAHDAELERLKNDFNTLIAEADAAPMTKEEMDVEVEEWKKEKDDRERHLNNLDAIYQSVLAHRRDLIQKGVSPGTKAWKKKDGEFQQESQIVNFPANLVRLSHLYDQTHRFFLDWANLLWERQNGTNRSLWQQKMQGWLREIEQSGPAFKLEVRKERKTIIPEFPSLSMPTRLTVDKLGSSQDVEDLEQGPRRQQQPASQKQTLSFEEFLDIMARSGSPAAPSPKPRPGTSSGELGQDDPLLDLLLKMTQAAQQNKRNPPAGKPKNR